jgi:hypothetical protein
MFIFLFILISFFLRLHSVDHIIELCDNIHSSIDSHAQLNAQKQNIRDEAQRIQNESETLALRLDFRCTKNISSYLSEMKHEFKLS